MVRTMKNCPVRINFLCNANTIYGYNVTTLKGKIVCQKSKRIQTEYIVVLESLRERIGNMTVSSDVMFVNDIQFVVSVFRGVDFITMEYVRQRLNTVLSNFIEMLFQFYKKERI